MTGISPRTTRVPIFQGDDIDRLAQLDKAVERTEVALRLAEQRAKPRGGTPATLDEVDDALVAVEAAKAAHADAVAERDAFAAAAEARGVVVVLTAQPRRKWREIVDRHPARPGVAEDESFGVNVSTMADELVPASIDRGASTITGDLDAFLDSLADYDFFDRLFLSAFALNRGSAMADPTQRLASGPSQT